MNAEQERAEFEAWAEQRGMELHKVSPCDGSEPYYLDGAGKAAWAAWQARAALQSQDREDAERLQYLLRRVCMYQAASYGCKFEILNLPPHFGDCEPDPIPPFLAAIDQALLEERDALAAEVEA